MITSIDVPVVAGIFLLLGVGVTTLTGWLSDRRRLKADRLRLQFEADRALDSEIRHAVANFISASQVMTDAVLSAADAMNWDLSTPPAGAKFLIGRVKALRHPVKNNGPQWKGVRLAADEATHRFTTAYYELVLVASSSLVAAADVFVVRADAVVKASSADRPVAQAAYYKAQGALVEAARAVVHVAPEPKVSPVPLVRPPAIE